MRRAIASALLGAVLAASIPAMPAADVFVAGRVGDVFFGLDTRDHRHRALTHRDRDFGPRVTRRTPPDFGGGPVNDFARDQHRRAEELRQDGVRHFPRHHPHYRGYPYYYGGYGMGYRDEGWAYVYGDAYVAPTVTPSAVPRPEPESAPPAALPTSLPDPLGPARAMARGRLSVLDGSWSIGRPLPAGVPHVTLDWEVYGLPRPPAGQIYARVGTAVLLIEADSRVVRKVL